MHYDRNNRIAVTCIQPYFQRAESRFLIRRQKQEQISQPLVVYIREPNAIAFHTTIASFILLSKMASSEALKPLLLLFASFVFMSVMTESVRTPVNTTKADNSVKYHVEKPELVVQMVER